MSAFAEQRTFTQFGGLIETTRMTLRDGSLRFKNRDARPQLQVRSQLRDTLEAYPAELRLIVLF